MLRALGRRSPFGKRWPSPAKQRVALRSTGERRTARPPQSSGGSPQMSPSLTASQRVSRAVSHSPSSDTHRGAADGPGRRRPATAAPRVALRPWGAADGPAAAILGRKPAKILVAYRVAVCEPGRLTPPKQRHHWKALAVPGQATRAKWWVRLLEDWEPSAGHEAVSVRGCAAKPAVAKPPRKLGPWTAVAAQSLSCHNS